MAMRRVPHPRRVSDKDRIRVSRACTACRGRKVRCVPRLQGPCQRCAAGTLSCVFDEIQVVQEPWKSSPRLPAGYASEQQLARVDTEVRVLGEFAGSPVESFYSGGRAGSTPKTPEEVLANRQYQADHLSPQESSPDSDELEGAILLVEEPGRTQYTGLRSNESFLLCVRGVLSAEKGGGRVESSSSGKKNDGTLTPPQPTQSKEVLKALQEFPPQEISSFLVSIFFYYVEATFCYCDREWFVHTLQNVYSGNASPQMADDAFVCYALLVFAFGSQFAHLRSSTEAQDPLPSVDDPGRRFYDAAQTLIPRVIAKCTLKGIQVCLLAGLYNLPSNLPDTSYLYLGIAMRMSIASGLHRKTTASRLDQRLVELRNRLWWTVYCIDRRISIALGRPASIAEEDIDAPYPKYHPALDDFDYQSNVQHQIEYIKLTRIVNQIMQNIPLETKPVSISALSAKLKQWRSQLFTNLHPNDLVPDGRNFRTTIHLQVHYHWAWIRMGRASLLQLLRERIHTPTDPAIINAAQSQNRQELTNLCVDAAKATIQLILVLKKHNLLCRFSFTDHQPATAALIILVLDSILQNSADTSTIIHDGVEMLRFMSHGGCRGAKSDLQTVEQLRVFANSLRQRIYQGEISVLANNPQTAPFAPAADAYQSWVNWMSEKEARHNGGVEYSQKHSPTEARSGDGSPDPNTETMVPEPNTAALDISYPHSHTIFAPSYLENDIGFEDGANLGFEWDNGRLDMLDMTQLLTGYTDTSDFT